MQQRARATRDRSWLQTCSAVQQRSRETAVQPAATVSCKVQSRVATHRNKKAGIVSRQPARGRASGITSRARATLGITAARAPPHAGRWESLDTHAGTRTGVSRITVTCRVRNNRIICQSSDPLEGMAITLNQWILLTARAIQSDDVAPNAPPHTPPAVAGRGRAHSALTCVPASLTQKTDERR